MWGPQRFPLGQTSSQPALLLTFRSMQRTHIIFGLYTDEDMETPRFQGTGPSQSKSPAALSAGRVDRGLARSDHPPLLLRSEAHTLHWDPAPQQWQSTEKEFPSLGSQTQMLLTGLHSFPWRNLCFLWKGQTEGLAYLRCFQIWPALVKIIELRSHAAGRGLGIVAAGASELPGQLVKRTDSWVSLPGV